MNVAPLILLVLIIATDVWVYVDSSARINAGNPVVVTLGTVEISAPVVWVICCLILWIIAFPLYLVARSHTE